MARYGMLARYSFNLVMIQNTMRKKESACKTLIVCFWRHFKLKMSEIDHTNSSDPDQAQQNVWLDGRRKVRKI